MTYPAPATPRYVPGIVVRDRMTAPVLTVPTSATLDDITRLFEQHAISAAPVTAGGRLVGVVSTTDVLRSLTRGDGAVTAEQLMTSPPLVARPDEPLAEATRRLVGERVHRLVVASGDRAVGILSASDLYEELLVRRPRTRIRDIMTTPVETINLGDSIDVATQRLSAANVHELVVLDVATPVGAFTHREAIAARTLSAELRERPVEEVMSYETICLNVETPIFRAAAYGMVMNVRRFLVVEHRRLLGIVSALDLASVIGFAGAA